MLRHALTYSSDLIIRDPGVLASLCVFFDTVYLPYLPTDNAGLFLRLTETEGDPGVDFVEMASAGEYHHRWDAEHSLLFAGSVLQRLPQPSHEVEIDEEALGRITFRLSPNVSGFSRRLYFLTRVIHLLRSDQLAPHVIDADHETPTRQGYKWLMAHEAFAYFVLSLTELTSEQILEVRDEVADTREGFAMHLQKLSRETERRSSAGDPLDTIKAHARSIIETDLIPDFMEFRRQLSAKRAGFWCKLLDVAAKSVRLLVPMTQPELAGSGFATLSAIMAITCERRGDRNTNVGLAFQFLNKLTSSVEESTNKGI